MIAVQVVGLGMGPEDLTPAQSELIARAEVLAGGRRQLDYFADHPARRLVISSPVPQWLERVRDAAQSERVVVLASGDPSFFGIGFKLVKAFGPDNVVIHANITTVQAAFARLKQPWQEATVVSLHGRGDRPLWSALMTGNQVAMFTDPHNTPAAVARAMLARGQDQWSMVVAEDLSGADQRVERYTLAEASKKEFSPLNLVVLDRLTPRPDFHLGMPEDAYEHQDGLITKSEVRATALARLELGHDQYLWDLGAGCGSVGLEASLLMPGGSIVAVERAGERVEQIKANRQRFQISCLEVIQGEMPGVLDELAEPERVFIGGAGASLQAVIAKAAERLASGGVMVAALVRLEGLEEARQAMAQAGMNVDVVQVAISRGADLAGGIQMKALNPVWLVRGKKDLET